jgi:hypothetical protein
VSNPSSSEAYTADVQEQGQPVVEEPPAPEGSLADGTPEADAAEQQLEVALDEEDAPIG